ncbi:MAG: insulinase family protein [Planctomycetes bacterium]|nr:insulinase family protein [Planctomycetota bacterium]
MRPVAMLALLLAVAPAALAAEREVLDNGLTVLLAPRPDAAAIAVRAFVRGGRSGELPALAGASHFFEHLVFRTTARREAGSAEREVWRLGGRTSAFTSEDFTEYGVLLPREQLDLALDILSDALTAPAFLPAEVEEERRVVLDEIARGEAEPDSVAHMELRRLAFGPHPYGERIYGSAETVARISREDLAALFAARVRPEHTVLVLAGAFDPASAMARIRHWFGEWRSTARPPPPVPAPPERFGRFQEAVLYREGAGPALYLSVALPGYLHPDYLPLRFLKEVLTGWVAQRLVTDTSLALAAETYFSPMADRNLLSVHLTLPDPPAPAEARDALLALLAELPRPDFPLQGIPQIAAWFEARERLAVEDLDSLARHVGRGAIYGFYSPEGPPAALSGPDRYRRIGEADLRRVAARWVVPSNLRLLWLLPPGSEVPTPASVARGDGSFGPPPPVLRVPDPAPEETLTDPSLLADEGFSRVPITSRLTLLHVERAGPAIVSGALAFPAGSRYDPPGREGLSALTLRAAAAASAAAGDDIRWRMYALGNSWSLGVERDLAILSFTVPAEGLETALRTVSEMIHAAEFPEAAVAEARGTLLRDQRAARERPTAFAVSAFRGLVFHGGPYANEPLGTPGGVTSATRAEIEAFHRDHYLAGPVFLSLVGSVAPRKARELAALVAGPDGEPVLPATPTRPPPADPPPADESHPSGRAWLVFGATSPRAGAPGEADAAVLQMALGWQVFRHFTKDRSTAYEAGAFVEALADAGILAVYAGIGPDRTAEAAEAMESFLATARDDGVPEELARDARTAWLSATAIAESRSITLAIRLARRAALAGPAGDLRARVAEVTPASLAAAAREILAPGRLVRLRVRPAR